MASKSMKLQPYKGVTLGAVALLTFSTAFIFFRLAHDHNEYNKILHKEMLQEMKKQRLKVREEIKQA